MGKGMTGKTKRGLRKTERASRGRVRRPGPPASVPAVVVDRSCRTASSVERTASTPNATDQQRIGVLCQADVKRTLATSTTGDSVTT